MANDEFTDAFDLVTDALNAGHITASEFHQRVVELRTLHLVRVVRSDGATLGIVSGDYQVARGDR